MKSQPPPAHSAAPPASAMRFAFLSDGKLFLKTDDAAPRPLSSPFAAERAEREKERAERHAWKGAGRDPQETFNARMARISSGLSSPWDSQRTQ